MNRLLTALAALAALLLCSCQGITKLHNQLERATLQLNDSTAALSGKRPGTKQPQYRTYNTMDQAQIDAAIAASQAAIAANATATGAATDRIRSLSAANRDLTTQVAALVDEVTRLQGELNNSEAPTQIATLLVQLQAATDALVASQAALDAALAE